MVIGVASASRVHRMSFQLNRSQSFERLFEELLNTFIHGLEDRLDHVEGVLHEFDDRLENDSQPFITKPKSCCNSH